MSKIILKGDTSGEVSIQAPAVAGNTTIELTTVGGTILAAGDIGTTIQAYDADTAKYDDTTANFTGTLQNGGSNVVVDTDIGSTVQAYDADTAKYDDVTANFTGTLQVSGTAVVKAGDNISTLTNDAGYVTGNQTITLSGDVTGSGTTAITVTVADDSHNHIISNVDGLQTALDGKAPIASPTFTGNITVNGDILVDEIRARTNQDLTITCGESFNQLNDATYNDEIVRIAGEGGVKVYASSDNLTSGLNRETTLIDTSGNMNVSGTVTASSFSGALSGNASTATKWATGRTISLTGDVTGTSASFDGSSNASITATIANNSVGADELNVSGNGTTAQYLRSDGDGTFTWQSVYDVNSSSTGYFDLPSGTTAQRPGSPNTGMVRYNTTESQLEIYNGSAWQIVTTEGYSYSVDYLIVAGGASGGTNTGGGGGAGGLLSGSTTFIQGSGTTYSFTIGAGGAGQASSPLRGNSGSNTTGLSLTAVGGGGGGAFSGAGGGLSGGSGGGGGASAPTNGGAGTAGQGNAGGNCSSSGSPYATAGGGGAGAAGANNSSTTVAGAGGVGLTTTIITTAQATSASVGEVVSTSVYFAGGGGGGGYSGATAGAGGSGGGTAGGVGAGSSSAAANTGGGTGGVGNVGGSGAGGSGVVILRMPTANYSGTTTGSPTVTTDGTDTILIFKSSGSYTA